jgi:hypothetical protein
MTTFRDYLSGYFALDYTGTDDNMPDAFDEWVRTRLEEELADHFLNYIDSLSHKQI